MKFDQIAAKAFDDLTVGGLFAIALLVVLAIAAPAVLA